MWLSKGNRKSKNSKNTSETKLFACLDHHSNEEQILTTTQLYKSTFCPRHFSVLSRTKRIHTNIQYCLPFVPNCNLLKFSYKTIFRWTNLHTYMSVSIYSIESCFHYKRGFPLNFQHNYFSIQDFEFLKFTSILTLSLGLGGGAREWMAYTCTLWIDTLLLFADLKRCYLLSHCCW